MPLVYFDASAFVKLLTTETGSSLASAPWDGCDAALSGRLAYPEVRAALAAAARNHDLTESELAEAERDWEDFWAATRPVELTTTVEHHAGHLAHAHALRGAEAVHLASALAVGAPGLIIAAWDRRLHTGAQAAGCGVAPPPDSTPSPPPRHRSESTPARTTIGYRFARSQPVSQFRFATTEPNKSQHSR